MDVDAFFREYTDGYNRALAGERDFDRIRAFFTDAFLGAGPETVSVGRNDDTFTEALRAGYDFYRAIGTRKLELLSTATTPIDGAHLMAKVFYRAEYESQSIDFDVTYLLQTSGGRPKIFAFVAGDEMDLYRRLGLVDAEGRPIAPNRAPW